MSSTIIILRPFNSGDATSCKELIRDCLMSFLSATFFEMLFKELVFQIIILLAAIMFIFVGTPLTTCLLVVPVVIALVFVVTRLIFGMKIAEVNAQVDNIVRTYMISADSCFWVAEAFKFSTVTKHSEDVGYTIMTEDQFSENIGHIPVSQETKQIVGTIGLCGCALTKSACIKMLYVHKQYRQKKGIAERLLQTAVKFASDVGYNCVDMVASEYREEHRDLCLKEGFELRKMYRRPFLGLVLSKMIYELTYEIIRLA
ncbi:probable N-acetyltransferase CML3 [Pseudomyrmex gracilis]|uniref:probable N-acetyltransferase CML3 n=1 Tax=Pseudomyrmex gracilis TaxID=219809 RepID=UPI000994E255|nr:probable N-acetyltransferase CML3 [Pseudomyrmex gracilis]XP_020285383.1 probable N-acetyltransferase CML3 [Pseudomyrmex gracilis]